jgi:hypothetical protein
MNIGLLPDSRNHRVRLAKHPRRKPGVRRCQRSCSDGVAGQRFDHQAPSSMARQGTLPHDACPGCFGKGRGRPASEQDRRRASTAMRLEVMPCEDAVGAESGPIRERSAYGKDSVKIINALKARPAAFPEPAPEVVQIVSIPVDWPAIQQAPLDVRGPSSGHVRAMRRRCARQAAVRCSSWRAERADGSPWPSRWPDATASRSTSPADEGEFSRQGMRSMKTIREEIHG